VQGAATRLLPGQRLGQVVEKTHAHLAAVRPPDVEGLAQKTAVLLRRNREGQRFAILIEFRERDVLDIVDTQFVEETVEFLRLLHVGLAKHTQDVELHFFGLHQFDGGHYPLPGPAAFLVETVAVVQFLGAVQRDAHQPVVLMEQLTPVAVNENGVGLQRVAHALPVAPEPLLELYQFLEER